MVETATVSVDGGINMNVEDLEPGFKTLHIILYYTYCILNLKKKCFVLSFFFTLMGMVRECFLYQAAILSTQDSLNHHELLQAVKAAVPFKRNHQGSEDKR